MSIELEVCFIDDTTGREIVRRRLPRGALPDRFSPRRRIELAGSGWSVVSCEPWRVPATDGASLTLRLREVPEGAFTLPTLAEELPRVDESAPRSGRLLELAEDDWAQIELVSEARLARVEEQLERIRRVLGEIRDDGFFSSMHIRGQTGPLLKGVELSLDDVAAALPPGAARSEGVVIEGHPGRVKDGFSFLTMNGLEVYGVAPQGRVKVLALRGPAEQTDLGVEAMGLAALCAHRGLRVVDWVNARVARGAGEIERFLGAGLNF